MAVSWTIAFSAEPGAEDCRILLAALEAATAPIAGPGLPRPVAVLLRDAAETTIGGLWGRIVYRWLFVEMLVVPSALRGQGIGRAVMEAAEAAASREGCIGMEVSTLEAQAPIFYERLGFTRYARLENCPPGQATVHLRKDVKSVIF